MKSSIITVWCQTFKATSTIILALLILTNFNILLFKTAFAQDKSESQSKGLTLSPLRHELEIAPGTSLDGTLLVTNSTDKTMKVNLSAEEFNVINQQYDYAFTAESNVAKWVNFESDVLDLAVGEAKQIKYTVGVPLSAEPGGRYISLFASTNIQILGSDESSIQRVASLLYITVIGDVTRAGNLMSLTSPWSIGGESTWSVAIQNSGTTHFLSRYNVQMNDLFWNSTVASMSGEALILPGTVRLVSDILPIPQWPGIYKLVYTIGLGDTPAKAETRFILYMPLWVAVLLIISVAVIFYWLFRRRFVKHQSV